MTKYILFVLLSIALQACSKNEDMAHLYKDKTIIQIMKLHEKTYKDLGFSTEPPFVLDSVVLRLNKNTSIAMELHSLNMSKRFSKSSKWELDFFANVKPSNIFIITNGIEALLNIKGVDSIDH